MNKLEKCPGVAFKLVFVGPGVLVVNSFFGLGVGNSPIKKLAREFSGGGGMVRLELTDT